MKKNLFLVVILLLVVTITGCNEKKKELVCTTNVSGIKVGFNYTFKGNKIININYVYDTDFTENDNGDPTKDKDFCPIIKKSLSDYQDAYKNCNQKYENKHLIVTIELDKDKINDNIKDKLTTIDSTKNYLELSGYSCEIK